MKQRSIWSGFLALLGIGIIGSLIINTISFHHSKGPFLISDHDRMTSLHGRMMDYHEHTEHYHSFGILSILSVLFVLFIGLMIICLLYRRFKNNQRVAGDGDSLLGDPISPSHYNKADFLDEWEKHTKMEEKQNGHISKD
jgi:hypothetical protein